MLKSQLTHRQTVHRTAQWPLFVPSFTGGQDPDLRQGQLSDRGLNQGHVRRMRRIKSAAKNPQALNAVGLQTQSLGIK
jgi:hypothetical protein